ncbi:YaaA family protein [Alienimonas chondri]|uniref:YaaA family protein n=1 Tax=Alienimonas chondri TaxID=2681879 RepID=UPI0019D580D3|nr:peroxide stress protein YaaA [Alienimonas chondri]
MLLTLSPSKTLAPVPENGVCEPPLPGKIAPTEPRLLDDSERLVKRLRRFSKANLAELMGVSESLAELNHARFRDWSRPFTDENSLPAVRAFRGDVYDGLAADDWTADDLAFAQPRVRILSGLYGALRPLDRIQPYRLEMGTRFPKATKANPGTLYEFWGDRLESLLKEDLAALDDEPIVLDLASREYAKAAPLPGVHVVTPAFKEEKADGPPRIVALFAKRARGAMARWVVKERATTLDRLLEFDALDYRYRPDLSKPTAPVFTRRSDGVRRRPGT